MLLLKKNLANFISSLRILALPLLVRFADGETKQQFVIFSLGLVGTDILDGYVARKFGISTQFGRKFDSFADYLFYTLLIFLTILILKDTFLDNFFLCSIPILFVVFPKIIGIIFSKRISTLHLTSWRIAAGVFIVGVTATLLYGFKLIYIIMVDLITFIACIEESLIFIIKRRKIDENIHSIFELV